MISWNLTSTWSQGWGSKQIFVVNHLILILKLVSAMFPTFWTTSKFVLHNFVNSLHPNHHIMYPHLFTDCHLLTAQKPVIEYSVIEWFVVTITQRFVYYIYTLLDVVVGLHTIRKRTENLHYSMNYKASTWVFKHSVQNHSIGDFMSKCSWYILVKFRQYNTSATSPYWLIYISMLMHQSSSRYQLCCESTQKKFYRLSCVSSHSIITLCSCKHGTKMMHSLSNNQQTLAVQQWELCLSKQACTHKIDVDNLLHTLVCEAFSIEMTVLAIYLWNYYRAERLSTVAQMILHCDVRVNYKNLV